MDDNLKTYITIILTLAALTGCGPSPEPAEVYLAQGTMTGEVTATSAVLQTRLTASPKAVDGDVPGKKGMVKFEIDISPEFGQPFQTGWINAIPQNDFIVRTHMDFLSPDTLFYYRILFTHDMKNVYRGGLSSFRTLPEQDSERDVSFVVVTGMNYGKFNYGEGNKEEPGETAYKGRDKHLGFPGLEAMLNLDPDFMVATGDNVYYDSPSGEKWVATTLDELRRKWHEQFVQPRFIEFFSKVPVYWEKDDHDFRFNDCDTTGEQDPSSELGIATFIEQVPIAAPDNPDPKTYRTHRINKNLQIWLMEGRDYRSPNLTPDGPGKTLWGKEQLEWLKETLLSSDAQFKILISPTPLIGPDDSYKKDNHTNPDGFQYERDQFFEWLATNNFHNTNFYLVCGDRHWQYHSIHPSGFEEFSCGALVNANSREGRLPGDPESTDPEGKIIQPYVQGPGEASGGFLNITLKSEPNGPVAVFTFFDEHGKLLYTCRNKAKINLKHHVSD